MNAKEYANYRLSEKWKQKRAECMKNYDHRCQICGCTHWRRMVDVHHLHYQNIGNENPKDLIPLCSTHHELIHNQADGYNSVVLERLRQNCEENNWDDPPPTYIREKEINSYNQAPRMVQCPECYSSYEKTAETTNCEFCGQPDIVRKSVEDLNTEFFEKYYPMQTDTKSTWSRLTRKP